MTKNKVIICPYCGDTQPLAERCRMCLGLFEPLSRQATHNAMGPWFVRNLNRPYQPGCSYETLVKMIERAQVTKNTIVRGPTTRQFWTVAKRVPGIAHLLGYCHNCDASVDPGDHGCHACGVPFGAYLDRNFMGLPDVKPLPWEAPDVEQRQAQSASRGIEWRRAAEPLGLSSFASDDELRSTAMAASSTGGGGASARGFDPGGSRLGTPSPALISAIQPAAVAMVETAAATSMRVTSVEPSVSTAATRAMRRRLEQLQRTVRTLTIVLIAAIVLAVVVLTIVMASRGGQAVTPAKNPGKGAPITTSDNPRGDENSALTQVTDAADADKPSSAASQPDQSMTSTIIENADHQRALELIREAAKTDRPVADRITDLEEARGLLLKLAANSSADQRPPDLEDRLKHVNAELDRLRMQKMFP